MRPATLAELARRAGLTVPPPLPTGTVHPWSAFQQRYDAARAVLRTVADIRRVAAEAAADARWDGCGWWELQVDPTSYAEVAGGLEPALEAVLDALAGQPVGVVVASSWARSGEHAVTLARLAARYAPHGVVGFGLSNDERLGRVEDFVDAFRVAAEAGLAAVPHAGFYEGAWHVRDCVELLGARRIGHGLTAAADASTVELLATRGVALEVCPASYPPLGVAEVAALPLRALAGAGVPVALGTDDPLLFGADLTAQYALCRDLLGHSDAELATLARQSVAVSAAPEPIKSTMLAGIDDWLS